LPIQRSSSPTIFYNQGELMSQMFIPKTRGY